MERVKYSLPGRSDEATRVKAEQELERTHIESARAAALAAESEASLDIAKKRLAVVRTNFAKARASHQDAVEMRASVGDNVLAEVDSARLSLEAAQIDLDSAERDFDKACIKAANAQSRVLEVAQRRADAWRAVSKLAAASLSQSPAATPAPEPKPAQAAKKMLQLAVRLVPTGHQARYREEFRAELNEVARDVGKCRQIAYVLRLSSRVWSLRRELLGRPSGGNQEMIGGPDAETA
jgi:hypothetical protein